MDYIKRGRMWMIVLLSYIFLGGIVIEGILGKTEFDETYAIYFLGILVILGTILYYRKKARKEKPGVTYFQKGYLKSLLKGLGIALIFVIVVYLAKYISLYLEKVTGMAVYFWMMVFAVILIGGFYILMNKLGYKKFPWWTSNFYQNKKSHS